MKLSGDWLHAAGTQALLQALVAQGFQALFVGGCVRNAILDMPVSDIDLATDAHPETVLDIARAAGFRAVPTGLQHGTVTVIVDGVAHEVTTLRRDVATDGRHAIVAYSTSVAEDAARRDFTMNAVYAQASGAVVDPLGGLPDVLARQVRFVGDPDLRIREDYLRILRFFRFHAVYGDPSHGIDAEGLAACAANCAETETLSRERVGAEMRKLLSAINPGPAVAAMAQAGVLRVILPGASAQGLAVLAHLEDGMPRGWLCRLAVLGGDYPADRLRLSRADANAHDQIRAGVFADFGPDALGWLHGVTRAGDIVYARAAMSGFALPDGWQVAVARGAAAVFPVKAADLMPALQGKALGARLLAAQDQWLRSGLTLTGDQLLA